MGEITFKGFKCERCGHIWAPRQALDSDEPAARPRVCPQCKSAWWDVPKKKKGPDGKRAAPRKNRRKAEKAEAVEGP